MKVSFQEWVPLLRETLSREGRLVWQVEGQSMAPTLSHGSAIEIRALDGEARPGDLLVFAEREALVVHRLVARRNGWLILQGDNRKAPDPPILPAQVIGKVTWAHDHRTLTYPYMFIRGVALFWIARYHWYRALRFLGRLLRYKGRR